MTYELTDHLGNVRALVRENVNIYTATMEDSQEADLSNPRVTEMTFFQNIVETQKDDPSKNHTPQGATSVTNPSRSALLYWGLQAEASAEEKSIGPAISLKVKSGDKLELEAFAQYELIEPEQYNRNLNLATIASFLAGGYAFTGVFEGSTTAQAAQALEGGLLAIFGDDDANDAVPYAYLNYVLFDKNMLVVGKDRKRLSTSAANVYEKLEVDPIDVTSDGYIYAWVSNESENVKVWFDDMKVTHTQIITTQATDYGVWGDVVREEKLEEENYRFGYQGQFAERDDETGWNHFELREYDPIVGRWVSTDPNGQYWSHYMGMGNNPINGVDPDGGLFSDYVNQTTGEKRHIDDGINVVVTIKDENWNSFLKWFDASTVISNPSVRFNLLSKFGTNYDVGEMLDFYNMHKNSGDYEYGTKLLSENDKVFPDPNPEYHYTDKDPFHVTIFSSFDKREKGNIHNHYSVLAQPGLSSTDKNQKGYGVYNVMIENDKIYFFNHGVERKTATGRLKWTKVGTDFELPRNLFTK